MTAPVAIRRLNAADTDFARHLDHLLSWESVSDDGVNQRVLEIIQAVRERGDAALVEYTQRFDGLEVASMADLILPRERLELALTRISAEQRQALEVAAERVRSYHEAQKKANGEGWSYRDEDGTLLGQKVTPLDRVGIYVPGGKAAYPSSLLMNAIPARVAGVERLVICVPTPGGHINPLVLLAAQLSGVTEIYRIGGAQAVAAMAYGTDTIAPVDKITGPGNAYVAAAKRQVFGRVGIDMIAGPSEVLVIAQGDQHPDWLALDLLAQAEHDADAQSILITTDAALGHAVAGAVDRILPTLPRAAIAGASWRDYGTIIVVRDLDEAATLSNRIAPEHLELCVDDPEALATKCVHAGAIFLGPHTPEAVGDYVSGPNHVLPTARSARFSSGLSVLDFLKRTTMARLTPGALNAVGHAAMRLAAAEGLQAHGESIRVRLEQLNERAPE